MQGIHAALEVSRRGLLDPDTPHPHIVFCNVKDERALVICGDRLRSRGIAIAEFTEPDRDNELTAIATEPLYGESRKHLSKLQLVRG